MNRTHETVAQAVGKVAVLLAGLGLIALHGLPVATLTATTGARIAYQPVNFLSEYVRTEYAPLMTACFVLLSVATLATAFTLRRRLTREWGGIAVAGVALFLLGVFPTDLADLSTDAVTCGQAARIEPCTLAGRIHNPLSTFVFLPILGVALAVCVRGAREPAWRRIGVLAMICAGIAVCGIVVAHFYLKNIGWHGRAWTGLMQRSLVFPALIWLAGLLVLAPPATQPDAGGEAI